MHWKRKWQPTPVFLPGESQGRGSLVGCRLWGRTRLKQLSSGSSLLGCAGSLLLLAGFSPVAASRGCALLVVLGLLIVVASLVAEHGL